MISPIFIIFTNDD